MSCPQAVHNAKVGLVFKGRKPFFPMGADSRQGREFGDQILPKGIQGWRCTLDLDEDAFRAVADRAAEPVFPRKAEYEGAEAYPLHLSGQSESASLLHAHETKLAQCRFLAQTISLAGQGLILYVGQTQE
jgi:hypothetical protein